MLCAINITGSHVDPFMTLSGSANHSSRKTKKQV